MGCVSCLVLTCDVCWHYLLRKFTPCQVKSAKLAARDVQLLIYVRHGKTEQNEGTKEMRGWSNTPLSLRGVDQARHAGELLNKQGIKPDSFTTSDLPRARQTATIVAQHVGMHPELDPSLRTWHVGALEGKAKDREMLSTIRHLVTNPNDAPPGGHSVNESLKRFVPGIKQRVADRGVHLVIGHGWGAGVIEGLASKEGGVGDKVDQRTMLDEAKLKPGGVMVVHPNWKIQYIES
jgi:broad specificity phosphatase PhoE